MKKKKTLTREIFETNRALEYFTEKELRAQIGHDKEYWPIAILRELIDNALDACENINVAPVIEINIKDDKIKVIDNGPGIPPEIIKKSTNYMVRVSDKAYYISPTRGQMGNALKVVYATPFVDTGEGYVEITSNGEKHRMEIKLDRIAGAPKIHSERESFVKNENSVMIAWPNSTRLLFEPDSDFYNVPPTPQELISGYSAFNPHATFILNGERYECTDAAWKKWRPNMPTSSHWYTVETLRDLIAGYLCNERGGGHKKTVREFVSEFRGLSGTAKQKIVTGEWSGAYLNEFVNNGDIDSGFLVQLLEKMKAESVAPKPNVLGIIGKDHLTKWMVSNGISEQTIKYLKKTGIDEDGMPHALETAFGVFNDDNAKRRIITGFNWSPFIGEDADPTIRNAIQNARLDRHDPGMFLIHISRPRFEFMDRGKTRLEI